MTTYGPEYDYMWLRIPHSDKEYNFDVIKLQSEQIKNLYAVYLKITSTRVSYLREMFEMDCLFLSGDFKFQVSPNVLISSPRSG